MTCCETLEIRYRLGGELVGLAIADRSSEALSAVYCYYDPMHERLSLGTYSILKQLELCRLWGLKYLYLGLYIAESVHMRYMARDTARSAAPCRPGMETARSSRTVRRCVARPAPRPERRANPPH